MPHEFTSGSGAGREEIFMRHYQWLMGCALRLTDYDHGQTEDLLVDVFVQFMLDRRDVAFFRDLRGHLHTTLVHLQVANVRQAARL
jgi:DNA-directed RNA polymerase specialized sigma24 family protein